MKKAILLFVTLLLFAAGKALAVPAYPGPIKHRQPDGSIIEIRIHGDEFFHYTTSNGQVVARDKDGFYRPAKMPVQKENARRRYSMNMAKVPNKTSINFGKNHFLVMLIDFADLSFSVPDARNAFYRLLNQPGYSENGGTGSAYDYYYENSSHQFAPVYDVIGPITVSGNLADYGGNNDNGNDKNPRGAFFEACQRASAQGIVDFSNYDIDGDGFVENIFFFYAGYSEAEDGGDDAIWPHASRFSGGIKLNGVYINSYACTAEYRGSKGTVMAGIGTFCHEFGHVLGLPDLYDVDYEKNGSAKTVDHLSLMCSGSYNNDGRTPPYLGALERWILGWSELKEWKEAGPKTIRPVYENEGYYTQTTTDNEFFLYEVRDGSKWDKYIISELSADPPKGMLIYHVDRSDNRIDGKTAASLWNSNSINKYSSHPCYYAIGVPQGFVGYNDLTFPGTSNATTFESTDWAGIPTGYKLSEISYQEGTVNLNLAIPASKAIVGTIKDTKGNPLEGVRVSAVSANSASAQALRKSKRLVSQKEYEKISDITATSGPDGGYELTISSDAGDDFIVTYSLDMYVTSTQRVSVQKLRQKVDVILYDYSEVASSSLKKHGSISTEAVGIPDTDGPWSITAAVQFRPADLASFAGTTLKTINVGIIGSEAERIDVFVDFGSSRVFTRTLDQINSGQITSVDVSDAGIKLPSDKDVFIGYALKNTTTDYWGMIDESSDNGVAGGGMYRDGFNMEGGTDWVESGYNFIISADVDGKESPFDALGIKIISNPGLGNYAVGSTFNLTFDNPAAGGVADSVVWYFDGSPVSGSSITLSTTGKHVIKAVLAYSDGSAEEIVQEIEVK